LKISADGCRVDENFTGESSSQSLLRDALWSCLGSDPSSDLDMARTRLTVNLGMNRETNISIDTILLMM